MGRLVRVHARSWVDARNAAEQLDRFVFRGQSDADWVLETSIERAARAFGLSRTLIAPQEKFVLKRFIRRACYIAASAPDPEDLFEWLALLQHHGGSTRLLDFTFSFSVASFFAMEKATTACAVWGVDVFALERALMIKYGEKIGGLFAGHELNDAAAKIIDTELHIQGELLRNDNEPAVNDLVVIASPMRISERLAAQHGTFLAPMSLEAPIQSTLMTTLGCDVDQAWEDTTPAEMDVAESKDISIIKFVIPRDACSEGLHLLEDANVSAATLFPGLDGFARSLNLFLRQQEILRGRENTER